MFTGFQQITDLDARAISSSKSNNFGTYGVTRDGRVYQYGSAGASNLAAGKVNVAAAHAANHVNRALAATAVGATEVTITVGATAVTVGSYDEGLLVINDVDGEGIAYRINKTPAIASSGTGAIGLEESVIVALTANSEGSLIANPLKDTIVSPSAIAHRVVGVNNVAITAAYYGWFQIRGLCSVLSDGIIAKGVEGIVSDAVNGAVETRVDASTVRAVGVAPEATVDTEYRAIHLTLL